MIYTAKQLTSSFVLETLTWNGPISTLNQFTQPVITCSKLTTETLEQGVKYVQS